MKKINASLPFALITLTALLSATAASAATTETAKPNNTESEPPSVDGKPTRIGTGNVEILGNLHLSIDYVDRDAANEGPRTGVSSNQSVLIFRGSEDLSKTLELHWQIGQLVTLDSSQNAKLGDFATFNSGMGLRQENLGTLFAGRHDLPFKFFLFPMFRGEGTGPYIIRHLGDIMTIMGTGVARATPTGPKPDSTPYNLRAPNTVMYSSPTMFSNLHFRAAYTTDLLGDVAAPPMDNQKDASSFDITFMKGALALGLAYEEHKSLDESDGWRLGGSYRIANTKFGGLYESLNGDPVLSPDLDRDAWSVWVSQNFYSDAMGENAVRLFYSEVDSYTGSSDTGANLATIQLVHKLSFGTDLYVLYSKLNNDARSTRVLGKFGHGDWYTAGVAGADQSGVSLGLIYRF